MNKKPHYILRYLVEGILIFGSVYGAFLLEDRRSKKFEKELLIGKLESLLVAIRQDSLKFNDMLEDIDSESFSANTDLIRTIETENRFVYKIHNNEHYAIADSILWYFRNETSFAPEWIFEQPYYQDILEGYAYLIQGDRILPELDKYYRGRRSFQKKNDYVEELVEDLFHHFSDKNLYFQPFASKEDVLEIVNSTKFKNALLTCQAVHYQQIYDVKFLVEWNVKVDGLVRKELKLQIE